MWFSFRRTGCRIWAASLNFDLLPAEDTAWSRQHWLITAEALQIVVFHC